MQFLICDDHPFVANAMAMTLEAMFDARVSIAHSFAQAIQLAGQLETVKLGLIDFHIPGEDSVENISALRALMPDARLIVFSGSDQDEDLKAALEIGIDGFLPKSATPDIIECAVRLVLAGGRYLPERMAHIAMSGQRGPLREKTCAATPRNARCADLTPRQQDVLALLARGMTNKELALKLGMAPATAKVHVAQIIGALGAANRTEAAAIARSTGLI